MTTAPPSSFEAEDELVLQSLIHIVGGFGAVEAESIGFINQNFSQCLHSQGASEKS